MEREVRWRERDVCNEALPAPTFVLYSWTPVQRYRWPNPAEPHTQRFPSRSCPASRPRSSTQVVITDSRLQQQAKQPIGRVSVARMSVAATADEPIEFHILPRQSRHPGLSLWINQYAMIASLSLQAFSSSLKRLNSKNASSQWVWEGRVADIVGTTFWVSREPLVCLRMDQALRNARQSQPLADSVSMDGSKTETTPIKRHPRSEGLVKYMPYQPSCWCDRSREAKGTSRHTLPSFPQSPLRPTQTE